MRRGIVMALRRRVLIGGITSTFFLIPFEKGVKLYAEVPSRWRKYKFCRGLQVPKSPLF